MEAVRRTTIYSPAAPIGSRGPTIVGPTAAGAARRRCCLTTMTDKEQAANYQQRRSALGDGDCEHAEWCGTASQSHEQIYLFDKVFRIPPFRAGCRTYCRIEVD